MLDQYRGSIPVYLVLAAVLRERIMAGELRPGALLPSEPALSEEFGVSRATAANAVGVLRDEGWISTRRGWGSRVEESPLPRVIPARKGTVITARPAYPGESEDFGGGITLVVRHADGTEVLDEAGQTIVRVS